MLIGGNGREILHRRKIPRAQPFDKQNISAIFTGLGIRKGFGKVTGREYWKIGK
jgi:hypothetical protein